MKSNLLVAFAGGALLASVAFYASSRPAAEAGVKVEANPVAVAPEAVPVPVAEPEAPPPPVIPEPKRKAIKTSQNVRKVEKTFHPAPLTVAAAPAPSPAIIAGLAPELSAEVAAPELVVASNLPTEDITLPAPRRTVTIPEKTALTIRLGERLASDRSAAGDAFFGTLDAPLVVDGFVIADRGSRVLGRVTDVEEAGRVKGIATLTLELSSFTTTDGQRIPIRTVRFVREGDTSKKDDAVKVGIGAAAGGAAGAGAVVVTRGKAAVLETETRLTFQLEQPVTVTER